jgi:hypothetical protein
MQVGGPNFIEALTCQVPIFNDLTRALEKNAITQKPVWNQFGTAVPNRCGPMFRVGRQPLLLRLVSATHCSTLMHAA